MPRKQIYGGLEAEDSNRSFGSNSGNSRRSQASKSPYRNPNVHSNVNVNVNSNSSNSSSNNGNGNSIIYEGEDSEQMLLKKYQMCEVLGVGSTSICHRCVDRNTGKPYACKIIDKEQIEQRFEGMMEQFHSEIEALKSLHHPNIIKLYNVYTTKKRIYIVMELMAGGELFDYVVQKGTLTEAEASTIVRMVTDALVYMHEKNIIHRDLKPENLLLTRKPNSVYDIEVKIIDFGLSKSMSEPVAKSFLGTRGYLAPEMLQRREYSYAADLWALGVIVFVLLCGCLPFDDDSSSIPSDELVRSKFVLRFPRWAKNLSSSAKDLLGKLLDVNPRTRFTAADALVHPWVSGKSAPMDSMLHSPGRIVVTPGRGPSMTNQKKAEATRSQMNQMIANRARANSLPRKPMPLVRKKSI